MSKDFLYLHFAVDQVLSVSGYDLGNGRMACKQKYWIKNMAVKLPILILFRFCLFCWLSPVSIVAASRFNYMGPCRWFYPMDTSSSIRHQFNVEIRRGKLVEISSILKGESKWRLWCRFDVEIPTWIRLSKSTKYWWVLHVDFSVVSTLNRRNFCTRCFHSIIS